MNLKTKRDSKVEATINLTIDRASLEKEIDALAKKDAKQVKIDGFRPGKAPVSKVKQMYFDRFKENATQKIMAENFQESMKELELQQSDILGEPFIEKFDEGKKETEVVLKVAIRPEVDLKGYEKYIPVVKLKKPTKKEIDERIMDMARSSATPKPCEDKKKKVENGDHVYLDFEGFVNDKPFDGGKAENYPLEIGSHSFIDNFEDQLIGLKVGDEKDINVNFPANYGSEELSGKPALFKCKINQIWTREVGKVDDKLAKTLLPTEKEQTVEKLKEKIENDLFEEEKMNVYSGEPKAELIDSLTKNIKFDIPKTIVDREISYSLNEEFQKMGQEKYDEIKDDEKALEKLKEKYREDAEQRVKFTFIVDKIALENKLAIDDREIHQMIYFEAMQKGQNPQEVLEMYEKNGYILPIKMQMLENKIIKFLFDKNVTTAKTTKATTTKKIVEKKPTEKKAVEKKTTTKKPATKKTTAKKPAKKETK